MKKMMLVAMMMVMTVTANAMSYSAARTEALFLSDKMAYELDLTPAQYEAVYEINLDYLMSLNRSSDVFGIWWDRRNADLRWVLTSWQFDRYMSLAHFYRPVAWRAGGWTFAVYTHYDRGRFFHAHPNVYVTYRGGNNRMHVNFYADRHIAKPAGHHHNPPVAHHNPPVAHHNKPAAHNNPPVAHNNKPTPHAGKPAGHNDRPAAHNGTRAFGNGPSKATVNAGKGPGSPNRQIAHNTTRSGGGAGHFGGRR